MVRRNNERSSEVMQMFGGAGTAKRTRILENNEELNGAGRLFSHIVLENGSEVGWHVHKGDTETYYVLCGRALYNDNGTLVEIGPGDVTQVYSGEGHYVRAISDEPLEMIALILFDK